jgi:glycerol-3-phosphate dehydrogenase (NAD(P)+)
MGAGNMGTALAQVLAGNGHSVRLWSIEADVLQEIRDRRLNSKYLEGITLHPAIEPVWEAGKAIAGATLVVVSVPSQAVGALARDLARYVTPDQVLLNVAKGLEGGAHLRMSEVISRACGEGLHGRVGSMGGPAIAIEIAKGHPMAVIIGFRQSDACMTAQSLLQNGQLKVCTTTDLCGLELCATLKNVYAIALGMADGLGLGANTKAFLATLALEEMCEINTSLGGERDTVYGLAGVGDLLTTGYSAHSRNRTLGEKLGANKDWQLFLRTNTVEGVTACRAVVELLGEQRGRLPLLNLVYEVLFERRPAPEAMRAFLQDFAYDA